MGQRQSDKGMEREKKVVLDASVITKWYSKERHSDLALRYKDMHVSREMQIVEPSLLIYEVSNALNYNPNFTEVEVNQSLEALLDLELKIMFPSKDSLAETIAMARKYGTTIYDSAYLALAKILDVKMITADSKFWERIKHDPSASFLS